MKRKIAFLLAAGMLLALLPVNTFATSNNTLTKSPTAVSDKAAFVEQGVLAKSTLAGAPYNVPLSISVLEIAGNDDIKEVVEAPYLEIEPKSTISAGSTIKLRLENAKWFMRDPSLTDSLWRGTVTGTALRVAEAAMGTLSPAQITLGDASNVFGLKSTRRMDLANEITITTSASGGTVYTRYKKGSTGHPAADILYTMTLSTGDARDATITFPNDIRIKSSKLVDKSDAAFDDPEAPDGMFWIPLTVRSLGESDEVSVAITDNNLTSISAGRWIFGATSAAMTSTYVNDPQTSRDEFPIDMLVIQEMRVGSMGNGSVEISAPAGFSFGSDFLDNDNVEIVTENFTYGSDVTHKFTRGVEYTLDFKTIRNEPDYSTMVLKFNDLSTHKSTRVAGTIFIRDKKVGVVANHTNTFKLYAEETAGWGDVNMRIRNVSGSDIVTNETFKAGTRKDWTVNFFAADEIPTLVSGRYEDDDAIYATDEAHLAATVAFNENTVNAWWSGRSTNFTLPEGVKVRKMEITKAKNIVQETALKEPGTLYNNYYVNTGKKHGYVTINGNTVTLANVQVVPNKKAELEMKLWLSVASGYEGDITLTAGGSGVTDDLEPVIIAKAINPIQVKTTVTDVRIGYQYYPVADVEIMETEAGMLERGKQVWLSVTDRINMDMFFTPGFSHEVTEGNIRIKNVDIATGSRIEVTSSKITNTGGLNLGSGTITFDVDGASSVASTIRFSNLQLKVDRTVPESAQNAYSIYVWGPNVAPNSDVFDYSGISTIPSVYLGRDQHGSIGIAAPYVKVVTSATDRNNVLNSVVKVTVGQSAASRNGEQTAIDPVPFIDSYNRVQIPVRALANLLGVTNEEIIWSDTDRTVTINMRDRVIQFAIDSDIMLVNGAQVRMDTTAMIAGENGRTFVPFRSLGEALGVTVSWDDATKTATYNADKE